MPTQNLNQNTTISPKLVMDKHDTTETDMVNSARTQRKQFIKPQGFSHQDRGAHDTAYVRVAPDEDIDTPSGYSRQKTTIFTILTDCACILLPLVLLGVVIVLWRLDGTPVTPGNEEAWRNAINILATIFPILFASIVGRLLSEASRWKLERGSTTGVLEQLMGSRTVGATISTLTSFRSVNALSLLLLLIWAFSPLGTQAILRMESTNLRPDSTDTTVTYFDTDAISDLVDRSSRFNPMSYSFSSFMKTLASLYWSLLTTPVAVKLDAVDLWGNVKIPFLSHNYSTWEDISSSNVTYSSLAGIPVNNFHDGNTTFNLESSYLQLKCGEVIVGPSVGKNPAGYEESVDPSMMHTAATETIWSNGTDGKRMVFQMPNGTWHGYNTSSKYVGDGDTSWLLAINRFVDAEWLLMNNTAPANFTDNRAAYRERPCLFTNETGIQAGRTTLLFQAEPRTGYSKATVLYTPIQSYCDVTQKYVESRVVCDRALQDTKSNCKVIAQRRSQRQHPSEDISQLSFPKVFDSLSNYFPRVVDNAVAKQNDYSLYYLQDPSLAGMLSTEENFLNNLTAHDLEVRLAQLLNTYLTLSQLSLHITRSGPDGVISSYNQTVPAETSNLLRVFHISNTWATICVLSAIVLVNCGVLGVVLKHLARGPEILGYVSTVYRDSRHIDLPLHTGRLEGLELSRKMKDFRIQYGVVTRYTKEGEPLFGVGRQEDIMQHSA